VVSRLGSTNGVTDRLLVSIKEASGMLGLRRSTIYNLIGQERPQGD